MWGDRSGREPSRAKSPLRMRRSFSLFGAATSIIALAVLGLAGLGTWWVLWTLALLTAIGLVDAAVISRHIGEEKPGSS
jgi:hypothetical protein